MEVDNWALAGICPITLIIFRVQRTSSRNLKKVIKFFFYFLLLHEGTRNSIPRILRSTVLLHELRRSLQLDCIASNIRMIDEC
jgi:hypothetical protein